MAKHKYIESPERMWELFTAYRKDVKAKPFKVKDWVGKDGDQVMREKEKPLTMEGFDNYCFEHQGIESIDHYFSNRDGRYADYVGICSRIRRAIRQDQIEGGMANLYNPSITQRLNGLVEKTAADDKKELTIKVKYADRGGNNAEQAPSGAGADTEGE